MSLGLGQKLMPKLKTKFRYKTVVLGGIVLLSFLRLIKKEDLIARLYMSIGQNQAALWAGMLWGEKQLLEKNFYQALINTGLIHIVVVSGTNLTILGRSLIEFLAGLIGRKEAIVLGLGVIVWYVNLVGWQIPVVRAALFLFFYYLGQFIGRGLHPGRGLFLVALVMVAADYKVVTEMSFWLSFLAFGAMLITGGEGIVKSTLWINLFLWPVLSWKFGSISLWAPLLNLGVLFLVEALTVLGFVGNLLSLFCLGVGKFVLNLGYPLLRYLTEIVLYFGQKGAWQFSFNWLMMIGWYLILAGYWYEKKKN